MIVAVPTATAITSPAAPTVATVGSEDTNVESAVTLLVKAFSSVPVTSSCWVLPSASVAVAGVITIDTTAAGGTVIVTVPFTPDTLAVMVVVPVRKAVTRPDGLVTDIQNRPKLFSTFMLSLLAEIYSTFPEQGDTERPELVLFIDEAHLIFKEASAALLEQIESIVKLIRSKGVGIYFVTQNPTDIPNEVLSQLGLKVQHALRAFTARDRKAIKLAAENYPISEFYDTKEVLTGLGIGEALVTALDEKGRPTPLAATLMRAPMSRMDILTDKELHTLVKDSEIAAAYNEVVDRESAYEILTEKIEKANAQQTEAKPETSRKRSSRRQDPLVKVLTSATFIRGVMGILNKVIK